MNKAILNKYGRHGVLIFNTWRAMIQRCYNKRHMKYPIYGGRGITVCPAWRSFRPFLEWAIVNGWEPGLSIERIDNMGSYRPGNCKFATMIEQNNNRRDNIWLWHNGQLKTLPQWVRTKGLIYSTVYSRLRRGVPVDEALNNL